MIATNDNMTRLPPDELRDACLHCAATIVIAIELGCQFEDCRLTDDGAGWPTFLSSVEIKYPDDWRDARAFPAIASIHEAGVHAVAKAHGRGPHRVNNYTSVRTSHLLDEPRIWKADPKSARAIHRRGRRRRVLRRIGDRW